MLPGMRRPYVTLCARSPVSRLPFLFQITCALDGLSSKALSHVIKRILQSLAFLRRRLPQAQLLQRLSQSADADADEAHGFTFGPRLLKELLLGGGGLRFSALPTLLEAGDSWQANRS